MKAIRGTKFCGNKISAYGVQNRRVDYRTLSQAFDSVLNNNIVSVGQWDLYCGKETDEDGEPYEVYQYFIISKEGAEILRGWTDEIVYYNDELDMYLWCITHYGTSWDYVLTDIKIEEE